MFREDGAIEGHDLRNICDRIIRQSRKTDWEKDVSGGDRPLQVTGDRDADDRCNAATIERIALHDNHRAPEAWLRAAGFG